jgi:putative MATE family efflux protein
MPAARSPLLEAPLLPLICKLAWPGVVLVLFQAAVSIADTHFVGRLGLAPLAGLALVFPFVMLLQMLSAGALGGGVSSAIARALGAGDAPRAQRLMFHALVLALVLGLGFTAIMLALGPLLFRLLGGRAEVLDQALAYANLLFGGCVLTWLANFCANMLRGQGAMRPPALAMSVAACVHIALSYSLTLGAWGLPGMGMRGAALAYVIGWGAAFALLLGWLMWGKVRVPFTFAGQHWEGALARDILSVGGMSSLSALQTVLASVVLTGMVGSFGVQALAGYGVGMRLELMQVPLVFAIGAALVPLVGMNIGAGNPARAKRAAFTGAAIAAGISLVIGFWAALFPQVWVQLFSHDPQVIEAGSAYLRRVAPFYPFMGIGVALYFASQGAQRVGWPVLAGTARLIVAVGGGWLVLQSGGGLAMLFWTIAAAITVWGSLTALAVWKTPWGKLTPTPAPTTQR